MLPSLLREFAGQVNLVYIDPPFATGGDFSYTATVPDGPGGEDGGTFVKQPSVIEQKAYRDTWGRGLDEYLKWFYETVVLSRELLADNGSIQTSHTYDAPGTYSIVVKVIDILGNDTTRVVPVEVR